MPFCPNCGSHLTGRRCFLCGAAAAGAQATPVMADNGAAVLCYLAGVITGVVFLVLAPYNQSLTIRFHAFQSILFHASWIVLLAGQVVVGLALPFELSIVVDLLGLVVWGGGILVWLYVMWKAYAGKQVLLPFIGPIAERQAAR